MRRVLRPSARRPPQRTSVSQAGRRSFGGTSPQRRRRRSRPVGQHVSGTSSRPRRIFRIRVEPNGAFGPSATQGKQEDPRPAPRPRRRIPAASDVGVDFDLSAFMGPGSASPSAWRSHASESAS